MKCAKCGYERQPNDHGQAEQCPKCGHAYSGRSGVPRVLSDEEFEQAQSRARARLDQEAARLEAASRPERRSALVACGDCDGQVSRLAVSCPHCGCPFGNGRLPIDVMNIRMEFDAMVWFIVKWALASIPAVIILLVLFFVLLKLIGWRAF
jgi:uncharacterized membrane protein YvbJ